MGSTGWRNLQAGLRQALQPSEFRIAPAAWPADWLAALEQHTKQLAAAPAPAAVAAPAVDERERLRLLADIATGLWRLRLRMLEPGSERPKDAFRREYRHLESVWDLLAAAGVRVIDHTGQPYDPGQALEVASRIPIEGLRRERVQETVRPTVYVGERHVQVGVVLVETPAGA